MSYTKDPVSAADARGTCVERSFLSAAGTIYLRDECSPAFVASLRVDAGLHAFTHCPEREHELLLKIASNPKGQLALAYTDSGMIVGQITCADADAWWQEVPMLREVAIEVSTHWRKLGIARQLIELVAARESLENWILLAMGLAWHWETEQLGLTEASYRALLARLTAPYGFTEYLTTEPNIRDNRNNILLARLGKHIEQDTLRQFYACLLRSDTLPGL